MWWLLTPAHVSACCDSLNHIAGFYLGLSRFEGRIRLRGIELCSGCFFGVQDGTYREDLSERGMTFSRGCNPKTWLSIPSQQFRIRQGITRLEWVEAAGGGLHFRIAFKAL